jgi:hypothetical protein
MHYVNSDVEQVTLDFLIGAKGWGASYAGAEMGDEGMALKIRTKAKDIPDGLEELA